MKHGFVKVAAVTPKIKVADTIYNGQLIRSAMAETVSKGAKVVVFPELCITGYSCGDLFFQETLLLAAKEELMEIASYSKTLDAIFFIGLPYEINGKLYNMAAVVSRGSILAMVPKTYIPNYREFYEGRYFTSGAYLETELVLSNGQKVAVGTDLIFSCEELPKLKISAEICEDFWAAQAPSIAHALAGATVIANLTASNETTGKKAHRQMLIKAQSSRLICGYIYASAGEGESTQDVVFSGHNMIVENGQLLAENQCFTNETVYSELDVSYLEAERRVKNSFEIEEGHVFIPFHLNVVETKLSRRIKASPFVPIENEKRFLRCKEAFMIQTMGLKKRLEHTNCQTAVIGVSGGLDSTLALLVTVNAFDQLKKDRKDIVAVTMPGFGTTDRTYENAVHMIQSLGATFLEVDIKAAVNQHFKDIGQDASIHDITYENSQARERTQILMDIANKKNGMVIGTGDLSELALGWATYNGDHMSMYGVNSSVPKTLVKYLVEYYADTCEDEKLKVILRDVLNTPVSPELLPPENGEISQKTEDIVGPYELHDFFLYYVLRKGFSPEKIYRMAKVAFDGIYEDAFVKKWLKTFFRRFFSQQFKRSCLPDGPKIGTVGISPRGDLHMPSDACSRIWLDEIEKL